MIKFVMLLHNMEEITGSASKLYAIPCLQGIIKYPYK